ISCTLYSRARSGRDRPTSTWNSALRATSLAVLLLMAQIPRSVGCGVGNRSETGKALGQPLGPRSPFAPVKAAAHDVPQHHAQSDEGCLDGAVLDDHPAQDEPDEDSQHLAPVPDKVREELDEAFVQRTRPLLLDAGLARAGDVADRDRHIAHVD